MTTKFTIAVDVDETVAAMNVEWLRRYNAEYNDNLTPEDLTTWYISKHVKPECGGKIFKYLADPTLYDQVLPIDGALEGVNALRAAGHHVIFVTSCGRDAEMIANGAGAKLRWLQNFGFLPRTQEATLDYFVMGHKPPRIADVIVDDREETVKEWGVKGILFQRPHNRAAPLSGFRATSWENVVEIVARLTAALEKRDLVPKIVEPAMMLSSDSAERKGTPIVTGVLDYFPLAIAAVARLSKFGNDKHNAGQPLHWSRGKSFDHADCIGKHLIDRGAIDPDFGVSHTVPLVWRALALLELEEEERLGKPISRGSR